ncbi:Hypothetical protein ORPV_176 [Orpheovirus IHUMI-LCC2]|uniref:Uncharacterized protein n=1 Tax=Orpheovirus IHUMI-LCC2 TaxID=2023057 RepID=A0A2I2L3J2_9VIRU|nr:Hypothetical protein ORPV_176 [Orpheovirus IHUMI-LCC2]SNW62080.1 Hypothetical protein ORPV_176 [Orpheovirus IHUMI-LCC2]
MDNYMIVGENRRMYLTISSNEYINLASVCQDIQSKLAQNNYIILPLQLFNKEWNDEFISDVLRQFMDIITYGVIPKDPISICKLLMKCNLVIPSLYVRKILDGIKKYVKPKDYKHIDDKIIIFLEQEISDIYDERRNFYKKAIRKILEDNKKNKNFLNGENSIDINHLVRNVKLEYPKLVIHVEDSDIFTFYLNILSTNGKLLHKYPLSYGGYYDQFIYHTDKFGNMLSFPIVELYNELTRKSLMQKLIEL